MRLNKYIALSTNFSRRQADELIRQGRISINATTTTNLSVQVVNGIDKVALDGNIIKPKELVYYALNKPAGYTCTRFDPFASQKAGDLVPKNPPVFPVGRLDRDTEGLLIMTNDGDLAYLLTHPRHLVDKEYFVEAKVGAINWNVGELKKLVHGVMLDSRRTKPARVHGWKHIGRQVSFYIIINEGRKRQIRRMAKKIGLEVVELKRVRIGDLRLSDLKTGRYRAIKPNDVLRYR